jgi:NADPH:quinone reductase-like Zn-dependent oxidoreductase
MPKMQAAVVYEPGGPDVLRIEERPLPTVKPGWVLVRIRAFGLNRSELITRAGGSGDAVKFPRVLGIECVGEVADGSDTGLAPGTTIVAAMGGMGRDFDGGYEDYALLPAPQVIPVRTTLPWPELGALPETFGTAWGSLELLELRAGQTLLVRGGTSSVGMAAITLAKDRGVTIVTTTRQAAKVAALRANGADHVILDDGTIAARVHEILPVGADALLELVGPATIADSLAALKPHAHACLTGFLAANWDAEGARATAERLGIVWHRFASSVITAKSYSNVFQLIIDGVESRRYNLNLDRTFPLSAIADAHRYMEANLATGKVVGLTSPS